MTWTRTRRIWWSLCALLWCGIAHAFSAQPRQPSTLAKGASVQETTPALESAQPYDPDLLYMGISRELDELPKGDSLTKELSFDLLLNHGSTAAAKKKRTVQIEKLSQRPPLFLLKNILTLDECRYLQQLATATSGTMETAQTRIGGDDSTLYRLSSQLQWIPNTSPALLDLARQVHAVFLPHEPCFHPTQSVEELQVVHYDPTGAYHLHHDGALRIVTVLYYLNDVAGTWFPLVDCPDGRHVTRMGALGHAQQQQQPTGSGGVQVGGSNNDESSSSSVGAGDAIAFYNYFQDGSVEWNAIHAGLPAASDKWIATHWYHHVPPSQCNNP